MWENCIWPESITVHDRRNSTSSRLSIRNQLVVPENVDAIRAMMELESDGAKSIEKTNKALGLSMSGWM